MLGLNCVDWNWKVSPAHWALYCVTLHVDHLLATPHMNDRSTKRFQTHRALFHIVPGFIKTCPVWHRVSYFDLKFRYGKPA